MLNLQMFKFANISKNEVLVNNSELTVVGLLGWLESTADYHEESQILNRNTIMILCIQPDRSSKTV